MNFLLVEHPGLIMHEREALSNGMMSRVSKLVVWLPNRAVRVHYHEDITLLQLHLLHFIKIRKLMRVQSQIERRAEE